MERPKSEGTCEEKPLPEREEGPFNTAAKSTRHRLDVSGLPPENNSSQ